ncbi:MAG: hypothetical protein KAS36_03230 [Anaerolineales bacterium]|nr:hypothetical protein [Anaerolineales bacterium]
MNNYIVLDSLKYKTSFGSWKVRQRKPHSEKYTAAGTLDMTYGPASPYEWAGDILAPVTPDDGSYGDIDDLRATLAKCTSLSYQDHYGGSYTVHAIGPFTEESRSPMWDAASNGFRVDVKLVKV